MSNRTVCLDCGQGKDASSKRCRPCWDAIRTNKYVERDCKKCGAPFRTHECQIARGSGLYCSASCARSGSPTRKRDYRKMPCRHCGQIVDRQFAELRRRKTGSVFCDARCWYAFSQRENNPQWNGGQHDRVNPESYRWRKAVIARDGGRCRNCSSSSRLEVHHIVRFGKDKAKRWQIDNGLTFCRPCHQSIRGAEEELERLMTFAATVPTEVWR